MPSVAVVQNQLLGKLSVWPGYKHLLAILASSLRLDLYIAGGAVRDTILGSDNLTHDFDIFLGGDNIAPALIQLSNHGTMKIGPFGSPRWYPEGAGTQYCDLVPITNFVGGLWPCYDMIDVLNQFDISGNAVAFELRTWAFLNPQNGYRDLQRRVIRAVRFDFPDQSIVPGHILRKPVVVWFRILHYASTLGCQLEPVTRSWLIANQSYIEFKQAFVDTFFEPNCNLLLLSA